MPNPAGNPGGLPQGQAFFNTMPVAPPGGPTDYSPTDPRLYAAPTGYGGYAAGAQDWTGHYMGLSSALGQALPSRGAALAAGYNRAGRTALASGQNLGEGLYQHAVSTGDTLYGNAQGLGAALGGITGDAYQSATIPRDVGAQVSYRALGDLSGAAEGRVPSAAEIQQQQGIASALRAQLTAAASARGGAYAEAGAQQQAAEQGANIEAQGVGQAAALRANEQATARGQFASAAEQLYGTGSQEKLSYEQLQSQQELAANDQAAQAALQSQQLGNQSALQGYQLGQQGELGFAGIASNVDLGYEQAGLQAQQAYEQMAQRTQEDQLNAYLTNQGQQYQLAGVNAQIGAQQQGQLIGGIGAGAGALLPLLAASDERVKTDVTPQGNADPGTGTPDTAAPAVPATDGLSKQQILSLMQGNTANAAKIGQVPAPVALPPFRVAPAIQPRPIAPITSSQTPPPINPPAAPSPLMSDARAKQDVSPAPVADALLATLDKSKSTFAYKNPADQPVSPMHPKVPGARFGGVIAQDLERVPEIGRQLVTDTPRGKQIEPAAGLSAVMMGLGRLAERTEAIERTLGVGVKR